MAAATSTETNGTEIIHTTNDHQNEAAVKHAFDLSVVRESFVSCIQADKTLVLREYVRAYEELCV